MKMQYLKHKKKWTAFTTINGVDIYELGDTEVEAMAKLHQRIANSDFLLKGTQINENTNRTSSQRD